MPAGGAMGMPQYGYYDDAYIRGNGGTVGVDVSSGNPQTVITAPAGYKWDPVLHKFVKTPTQAGTEANQFATAAMPDSLKAMLGGLSSGTGSTGSATGGFTGAAASGTGVPSTGMGSVGTTPTIPTVAPPDSSAATNAEYATAKDRVGKAGRASIDALRGELGATGMLGGGAEGTLVANQVNNAFGELGQVSRDQASKSADQAAEFAKLGYSGAITQRGQDVSAREAEARLATERQLQESNQAFQQAQLKSQQQLQLLSLALGGLKSLGSY